MAAQGDCEVSSRLSLTSPTGMASPLPYIPQPKSSSARGGVYHAGQTDSLPLGREFLNPYSLDVAGKHLYP